MVISFNFQEAYVSLKPLVTYVLAITLYSFFVFKFYMYISKKSLFKLNLEAKGTHPVMRQIAEVIFYILEYVIVYPLIVFVSFLIFTTSFVFLTQNKPIEVLMLGAMALLATVRISAYYNEGLSQDLAKVVPLAFLALLLMDATYFSVENSIVTLKTLSTFSKTIMYYLGFAVALEFVLRLFYRIFGSTEK